MTTLTPAELIARSERLPRVQLAHLPTPLEEMKRLSEKLGGPRLFIKREDCTGLAMGGNKTRHNEFVLGDVVKQGADMVVWGAGIQSNNCRQTTASCAKLGIGVHLVLSRGHSSDELQGNLLLDHLLGANIEITDVPIGPELDKLMLQRGAEYRAKGRNVYDWDRKRVKAIAAASYAVCMAELCQQLDDSGIQPKAIYTCAGGATGAGLALGKAALGRDFSLTSILPIHWPWDEAEDMCAVAHRAAELLDVSIELAPSDIDANGDYVGEDYGIPTAEGMEAIALTARHEGILLDPSYSGKAMGAVIDHIRQGRYSSDDTVVFIHTGGTPALFAYRDELAEMIPPAEPL